MMTNEEIRIAIAKAKGWRDMGGFIVPPNGDPRITWAAEWNSAGIPHWMPNYPEDIAAAWELWLEMKNDVTIWFDEVLEVWVVYDKKRDAYNDAKLLPVAICVCWLARKVAQDEVKNE